VKGRGGPPLVERRSQRGRPVFVCAQAVPVREKDLLARIGEKIGFLM
jgi:hypothetical protein